MNKRRYNPVELAEINGERAKPPPQVDYRVFADRLAQAVSDLLTCHNELPQIGAENCMFVVEARRVLEDYENTKERHA